MASSPDPAPSGNVPPPSPPSPPPQSSDQPPPSPPAPESSEPPPTTPSPPAPESSQPPLTTPSPPAPESSQPPPTATTPPPSTSSAPPPPAQPTTPATQSPPYDNSTAAAAPPVLAPPDGGELAEAPSRAIHHPRSSSQEEAAPSFSSSDDKDQLPVILGIIFGGVVVLVIIMVFLRRWQGRKNKQHNLEYGFPPKGDGEQYEVQVGPKFGGMVLGYSKESGQYGMQELNSPTPRMKSSFGGAKCEFSYEALAAATCGFSDANLLGQGGFGLVHKGVLPNGQEMAVKSLKSGSGQGEREFQAEVEIISRVHHRHLVSLVGYCIASGHRMLVYEFVPNATLEYHLHRKDAVMDWASRRRIAVGSAKGLAYLHEDCQPRIIHRDIKAANILIDFNFEAMVADFGLAKLTTDNHTHVSTRVMGTFGYLAPEYASSGKLSEKSDVFSFGVMLLELITGRRPIDPTDDMEDSLVDWARAIISKGEESGDYRELVDPRLENNYNPDEMARMISCAAASIRHSARRRPRMSQIVRGLDGNLSLDDLNDGAKAGGGESNNPYDTRAYNADIMKFRMMVMSGDSGTTIGSSSS